MVVRFPPISIDYESRPFYTGGIVVVWPPDRMEQSVMPSSALKKSRPVRS